ncbi:hypothetical protein [Streptomyces sp. NBC_01446]|uniref:hypothetical protein n=1 Tax=Streptomyces sp. NBC_01446 TaxID=2903870 RepID=UPI002250CCC5|nr:hypothetical protein [Streptomyces sp. NBC_01446]MCX4648886.1 hypothetical protein [Streptomyces sp. NBC_01446]
MNTAPRHVHPARHQGLRDGCRLQFRLEEADGGRAAQAAAHPGSAESTPSTTTSADRIPA